MTHPMTERGRALVWVVLAAEYRAHRSLWLAGLALIAFSAGAAPWIWEGLDTLRALASALLVVSLALLAVLVLLWQGLAARTGDLLPDDIAPFRKGVAFGLLFASLPVIFVIMVCGAVLC